jgi:hypothetical protein
MSQYQRNPIPPFAVWNLQSRPPKPNKLGEVWEGKRFFYWLFLRNPASKNFNRTGTIPAAYNKEDNSLHVKEPNDYVGILLNEQMLQLDKDINVEVGNPKRKLMSTRVISNEGMRQETQWPGAMCNPSSQQ